MTSALAELAGRASAEVRASVRRRIRTFGPRGPTRPAPTKIREEGEEPTTDGQELQHRNRQVGSDVLRHFVEPEQAVAETTDPGSINVGEAGVGGHVENDVGRIFQLGSEQRLA